MKRGDRFGAHRVTEPAGSLPQAAYRLDNTPEIYDNEVLIDVETLNIDAASFTQLKRQAGGDPDRVAAAIMAIVAERGKMQNPVTGSGGMLVGTVRQVGPALEGLVDIRPGDSIATLVSLSLTPLYLEEVLQVRMDIDQVDVRGQAILFESGVFARLPDDMPRRMAIGILDVAGAPARVAQLVHPGQTVVVLGASGKSGFLSCYQAKKNAGKDGRVIAVARSARGVERLERAGLADIVLTADATNALDVYEKVSQATGGRMADVTISCVSTPHTEMASIMATRNDGLVYFFSMSTSFSAAALGAEGIGSDVTMLIGNGYVRGHAQHALDLVRESPVLWQLFAETYGDK